MPKKKISLTVVARLGERPCHHGHKIGDSFEHASERGKLCPMAAHAAFLYVEILKYGGSFPWLLLEICDFATLTRMREMYSKSLWRRGCNA